MVPPLGSLQCSCAGEMGPGLRRGDEGTLQPEDFSTRCEDEFPSSSCCYRPAAFYCDNHDHNIAQLILHLLADGRERIA